MKKTMTTITALILIGLMCLFACVFTVNEGSVALVQKLGELQTSKSTQQVIVYGPGLHFKMPFITTAIHLDARLQNLSNDSNPMRVLTSEQKFVLVDYYVKWKIVDPVLYYKRTLGDASAASALLSQMINDKLRTSFGLRTITEAISDERGDIMTTLQTDANENAKQFGIAVIDVRLEGIELPQEVEQSVFQRMSSEREQVATNLRAEGKASAEQIQATADAQVTMDLAKSKAQAQELKAQGDAVASEIYLKAYSQNPEFYRFYKALLTYQDAFANSKHNTMVLDPSSDFFKFFNTLPSQTK
jgi:membrane protease subunit HflC